MTNPFVKLAQTTHQIGCFKKHPDFAGSTRPLKQSVPMAQGRALVVGGGVAGLATAAQLAREGMEVGGFAAKKMGILPANMGI